MFFYHFQYYLYLSSPLLHLIIFGGNIYSLLCGYGAKETFLTSIPNIFAFNVVSYLYFLKPFLKSEKHYKKISIFAVVMCGIYLFISILALFMTFPFITQTDETLSVYLVTRLISFGKFFQRVDAIFIFVWILIVISFISFNLYIVSHIIKKTFKLKFSRELVYPIATLVFSIGLMFKDVSAIKYVTRYIYRYYGFILVFIVSFLLLLLAYIKKKRQTKLKE